MKMRDIPFLKKILIWEIKLPFFQFTEEKNWFWRPKKGVYQFVEGSFFGTHTQNLNLLGETR